MSTNGHSKNHQIPKTNHPWRNYKVKFTPDEESPEESIKPPSFQKFMFEMVECWDTYTIPNGDLGDGYAKLSKMSDAKAAEWLMSFIKRTWVRKATGTFIEQYA